MWGRLPSPRFVVFNNIEKRYIKIYICTYIQASQVVLVVKNLPANARDVRDAGSIPGLGRTPGGGAWRPTPVFLPGESPWTEEPGGLLSMGSQRVRHD